MSEKDWTPAEHYAEATALLETPSYPGSVADSDSNRVLKAVAHALCGALRLELDYQERQRVSKSKPPEYAPYFEESDERP